MGRDRTRYGHVRLGIAFVLSIWIPPILFISINLIAGAIQVVQTGMCPSAPPDIPAYACSLGDYLGRMTMGIWALMGHLTLVIAWALIDMCLWAFGFGVWAIAQKLPPFKSTEYDTKNR